MCASMVLNKTPVFASELEGSASFIYCPAHLPVTDLSLCLSPRDADSCQGRLRALLVLFFMYLCDIYCLGQNLPLAVIPSGR